MIFKHFFDFNFFNFFVNDFVMLVRHVTLDGALVDEVRENTRRFVIVAVVLFLIENFN